MEKIIKLEENMKHEDEKFGELLNETKEENQPH
jgi:hypothetical protein